ncbi:MAG: VWA domain-containing protein [Planctomycetales bacterium]|nr:VWA domain-containing protein [Planctomycetales bacterium]
MVALSTAVGWMTLTMIGYISFTDPIWLAAGAVAIAAVLYGWRQSLVDFSRRQQMMSLAVRALLIVLASAAAAGMTWHRATAERFVVVAIDRSGSCQGEDADVMATWQHEMSEKLGRDHFALLEFGDEQSTDLSAAITLARAAVPAGYVPQILLLTDGRETRGNVLEQTANRRDVPISVVPLEPSNRPEVQLEELLAPSEVRVGEPFELTAVVQTRKAGPATLTLYRDGLAVDLAGENQIALQPGENRLRLSQQIDTATTANFTVQVTAADDFTLDDNQANARVVVAGVPRVLAVDAEPDTLDSWRWALEEQQIQVEVRAPTGLPATLAELVEFDAIVLSQVSATDISVEQMDLLRDYVQRSGGGLAMLGSDQSFGLGGYFKTAVDTLLPVRCDLEQEKEKPSLAMMLVVDRSGSMGGLKLKLAKDAAEGTLELLGPRDQLGLIAFDDDPHWISQLRSAADKVQITRDIRRLTAAGGTNLYPALTQAGTALKQTAAKLKHVILLTDGISAPAQFEPLVADLAAAQITISAVAVGEQADRKLLEAIALQGGGRFYQCQDPHAVPQIFAQETVMASKSAVEETPFVAQLVRATTTLRGVDFDSAPVLLGRVITRAKPTAEVVLATDDGDPLLVWWRTGLGMTLAFTSDAKSRWAAEWLAWPDFATFWAQSIRHIMRTKLADQGELSIERTDNGRRITLDLLDSANQFVSDAEVEISVTQPQTGDRHVEQIKAFAPGRYEYQLATPQRGVYLIDVTAKQNDTVLFRQSRSIDVGFSEEQRLGPVNQPLLRQLVAQTGGVYNATVADLLKIEQPPATRPIPLWRSLVTAMLLLLVIDVALRRVELGI